MQKYNTIRGKLGSVVVCVEGYFVERFINLCKTNSIEIWNIKNVNGANIQFEIEISNYKKLKKIARTTKCKIKVLHKKGVYFFLHRYRKRKAFLYTFGISMIIIFYLSTLIWNIEIKGLEKVKREDVIKALKESNIYVGKCRYFINPQKSVKYVRANVNQVVWITINVRGTNIVVELKERGEEIDTEVNNYQHIVAKKSGIITKIVAENGTRLLDRGMHVEKGQIAICGVMEGLKTDYSSLVKAKGILRANIKYEDKIEMKNKEIEKIYDGKKYYFLGFGINNKQFILNYLIKNKKYDITMSEYGITLFGTKISTYVVKAKTYSEKINEYTIEQQKEILTQKIDKKIEESLIGSTYLVSKNITFAKRDKVLEADVKYTLNEDIAEEQTFSNLEE